MKMFRKVGARLDARSQDNGLIALVSAACSGLLRKEKDETGPTIRFRRSLVYFIFHFVGG